MTVYNWKQGRSIPKLDALKKQKANGINIEPFKKLAIDWHLKQIELINKV